MSLTDLMSSFTRSVLMERPLVKFLVNPKHHFLSRSRKPKSNPPYQDVSAVTSGRKMTGRIGSKTFSGKSAVNTVVVAGLTTSQA